jgi:DNA-binding response OmpR family regulator
MDKIAKVLVVDDDYVICMILRKMLQSKGFEVVVLENPALMDDLLNNLNIDLVILDMIMPGISGIDLCTRLKKDNSTAHISVIMISALEDAEKICLDAGADDFISKPFDMNRLFTKIYRLTGTAA